MHQDPLVFSRVRVRISPPPLPPPLENPPSGPCRGTVLQHREGSFFTECRFSEKDEKPHTAGPDDTTIPYIKIKITKIPLFFFC